MFDVNWNIACTTDLFIKYSCVFVYILLNDIRHIIIYSDRLGIHIRWDGLRDITTSHLSSIHTWCTKNIEQRIFCKCVPNRFLIFYINTYLLTYLGTFIFTYVVIVTYVLIQNVIIKLIRYYLRLLSLYLVELI